MAKNLNARVQFKHDTELNWKKASGFVPLNKELIIYDKDETHNYERFKLGDGVTNVNNLSFVNAPVYTPSVSEDGILSWTNNGSLENPETVNIKGKAGADGYTPIKGTDYWTEEDKAEIETYIDEQLGVVENGSY